MTIHAFSELYLSDSQMHLATAFDYAINTCKINPNEFGAIFARSDLIKRLERGDPAVISGMSGIELAREILKSTNIMSIFPEPEFTLDKSPEYWAGWALSYYQWYSAKNFKDIFSKIPLSEIILMYKVFHEMDISQFVESMEIRYNEIENTTKLKTLREARGLSQKQLSDLAGIKLRSIQLFEQRANNIDKSQVHTLYKLSRVLGCNIEDLLENPESI